SESHDRVLRGAHGVRSHCPPLKRTSHSPAASSALASGVATSAPASTCDASFTPASAGMRQPAGSHVHPNMGPTQSSGPSTQRPCPLLSKHHPHPSTGVHAPHDVYCAQNAEPRPPYAYPHSSLDESHALTASAINEATHNAVRARFMARR